MRIICTRYLVLKQLRPSQINREQLIREVEINRRQCGASYTQWQMKMRRRFICGWIRKARGLARWTADPLNNIDYGEKYRGSCFTPVMSVGSKHYICLLVWPPSLIYPICDERIGSKIITASETTGPCSSSETGSWTRPPDLCLLEIMYALHFCNLQKKKIALYHI